MGYEMNEIKYVIQNYSMGKWNINKSVFSKFWLKKFNNLCNPKYMMEITINDYIKCQAVNISNKTEKYKIILKFVLHSAFTNI